MKKILIIVGIIITLSGVAQARIKTPGLMGAWVFEDLNTTGTATDSSGNGNHGTTSGTVSAIGKIGAGLHFDGIDDKITIPDSPSLTIVNNISLVAWVKIDTLSTQTAKRIIVKKTTTYQEPYWSYALFLNYDTGNQVDFSLAINSVRTALTSTIVGTNTDYHIAGTYDGSTMKIYLNGILDNTLSVVGSITPYSSILEIGYLTGDSINSYWDGNLDEVEIYNRTLTLPEIRQNMLGLSPGE